MKAILSPSTLAAHRIAPIAIGPAELTAFENAFEHEVTAQTAIFICHMRIQKAGRRERHPASN